MTIKTKLYAGNNPVTSLRTTVPQAVVEVMKLKAGDQLFWNVIVEPIHGKELIAIMSKSENPI